MIVSFKTPEMLRDEKFEAVENLISDFVNAKFENNHKQAERVLNKLFPSPKPNFKPNFSFSVVTKNGAFLSFNSKKEMLEWFGFE